MTPEEFSRLPIGTRLRDSFGTLHGSVYSSNNIRGVMWDNDVFIRNPSAEILSFVCVVPNAEETEKIDGMVVSTDTHCYHLIPQVAMQRLCERISLGEQTKGKDAWNAMSDNQGVLESRKALARRFGHLINHSYRLLGKLQAGEEWTEDDEREASAVMWGGMFAICAIAAQRKKQEK